MPTVTCKLEVAARVPARHTSDLFCRLRGLWLGNGWQRRATLPFNNWRETLPLRTGGKQPCPFRKHLSGHIATHPLGKAMTAHYPPMKWSFITTH